MVFMREKVCAFVCVLIVTLLGITVAAPVEIRLAGWAPGGASGQLLAGYIEEFNAGQSNVLVVQEAYTGEEPLMVAYAAGKAPDVALLTGTWPLSYAGANGMFLSLDKYIDGPKGFARSTFVPDMWSFTSVEGKAYAIAIDTNERALFVSRAAAENAGLSLGNSVRNWDDLLVWAKKLTLKSGDETQRWGFWTNLDNLGGTMWHWIWLNDGKLFSEDGQRSVVDHPNTVEAIQYLADMINVHGVAPPNHGGNGRSAFLKNQLGMVITHSGFIGQLQSASMDFVTIPGPPGSGKEGGRFSGASDSVMMILNSTKHPDEAWQFVRWLAIEKGVDLASQRSLIPLAAKGLRDRRFQQAPWNAFATSIVTYRPENYYNVRVSSRNWWGGPGLLQQTISAIMRREVAAEPALQEVARVVTATLQSVLDK